jgi:agmatine deiminase
MTSNRLPAEWEPQDAILLAWPHRDATRVELLEDLVQLYEALVSVICDYADVVIALPATEIATVSTRLEAMEIPLEYVYFYPVECGDIWVRDFGPLSVISGSAIKLLAFASNGVGRTGSDDLSNQFTRTLYDLGAFPAAQLEVVDLALGGGSVETDGQGTVMLHPACLFNHVNHSGKSKNQTEQMLKALLGARKVNWLEAGQLADDAIYTPIDSFARLCPKNTIVYVACDDEQDECYSTLKDMEQQLETFTTADGEPYRLLPLPWPGVKLDDAGERLPASYASFLIVNEAVLVPIFDSLSDEDALEVISRAFPGYEIFGIPCLSLLESGGSLHRLSMQLPEGVLLQSCQYP